MGCCCPRYKPLSFQLPLLFYSWQPECSGVGRRRGEGWFMSMCVCVCARLVCTHTHTISSDFFSAWTITINIIIIIFVWGGERGWVGGVKRQGEGREVGKNDLDLTGISFYSRPGVAVLIGKPIFFCFLVVERGRERRREEKKKTLLKEGRKWGRKRRRRKKK